MSGQDSVFPTCIHGQRWHNEGIAAQHRGIDDLTLHPSETEGWQDTKLGTSPLWGCPSMGCVPVTVTCLSSIIHTQEHNGMKLLKRKTRLCEVRGMFFLSGRAFPVCRSLLCPFVLKGTPPCHLLIPEHSCLANQVMPTCVS